MRYGHQTQRLYKGKGKTMGRKEKRSIHEGLVADPVEVG